MSDFFDEIEDPYSSFNSRLIKSVRNRYKSADNFPVKDKYVGIVLTSSSGILAREHYMYDQFYEVGGEDIAQKTLQSYKILVKELDDHRYAAAFDDLNRDNLSDLIGKNNYDMYDSFVVSPLLEMSKKSSISFLPGDLVYVNYGLKKQRIGPYIIGTKGVSETYDSNIDLTGLSGEEIQQLTPELVMVADEPLMSSPDSTYTSEYKIVYPRRLSTQTNTGLDNRPDNSEEENNLIYLEEEVIPQILPVLKSLNPLFTVTSVYRSDRVNDRVGGSKTSYHKSGLAFDVGGLAGNIKDPQVRNSEFIKAANYLKDNSSDFPWLRQVLVELWRNHLHIESFKKGEVGTAEFRMWATQESGIKNF